MWSMINRIGFVTQDDVLFAHLTVKETLTYAALLLLPKTMTRQQKEDRAMDVIYELGLERYTCSLHSTNSSECLNIENLMPTN